MASKKTKKSAVQDSYLEAARTNRILALEDMLEREPRKWIQEGLRERLEAEKARKVTA